MSEQTPPNELIRFSIDGVEVTARKGQTILQAALAAGIYIPYYCYHHKLSIAGNCRVCMVEIEGQPKLVPSCVQPAAPNQKVLTKSEKVKQSHRGMMEFLLLHHPVDCPICDKGGECLLQRYSMEHGSGSTRFTFPRRTFPKPNIGARIDLERNRCIVCGRCVRLLAEIAGEAELTLDARGNRDYITTFNNQPLMGRFSGNIIEVCPVGALTDKTFRFQARPWELGHVRSVCSFCGCGCNLDVQTRRTQLLRIFAAPNEAVNECWICDKGRYGREFAWSSKRLHQTLRGPGEAELSVALDEICETLAMLKKKYGGDSIAVLAGPTLTNEAGYLLQKLGREVLGSQRVDFRSAWSPTGEAWVKAAAHPVRGNLYEELEATQVVLCVGLDLWEEAPILGLRVRKAMTQHGATLIQVGPRGSTLMADPHSLWLQALPENEESSLLALLNGLTQNAPTEDRAVLALREAKRVRILFGAGWVNHPRGEQRLALVEQLAAAVRARGADADWQFISPAANSQGLSDMGVLHNYGPGYQLLGNGPAMDQLWKDTLARKVRALYVVGCDPLGEAANAAEVRQALSKLELLVVQDMYLTPTVDLAHYLIPLAGFAEESGTYTNVARQVQQVRPALPLHPGAVPAWATIQLLARGLGAAWNYHGPEEVLHEITERVPGYDKVEMDAPAVIASSPVDFALPTYQPPANQGSKAEDEFWLHSAPILFGRDGYSRFDRHLLAISPPLCAELHPQDAHRLGLSAGQSVKISNGTAELTLPIRPSEQIMIGVVFIPRNYAGSEVEMLLPPVGEQRAVKIRRA